MLYLLDANTLIDANRDYYGIGQVDEYWDWLIFQGTSGNVKLPFENYQEVLAGTDLLADWAKRKETKAALLLDEEVDIHVLRQVIAEGYANDLTNDEIEIIGRDPFLIAHALADQENRVIVTTETSKPTAQRQNRRVPDVAHGFGVRTCSVFEFGRALEFRTDWRLHLKDPSFTLQMHPRK